MKKFLWGFLLGAVVAFLAGVNVGKDKPILSNPFGDRPLSNQVRDTAEKMAEEARRRAETAAERAGEALDDAKRVGEETAADIKQSAEEMADTARETVTGPSDSGGDAPPEESKPTQ